MTQIFNLSNSPDRDYFWRQLLFDRMSLLWPNEGIKPNHLIYLVLSYLYSKGIISDKITSFWNYYFKSYLTWCVFSIIFKCLITSIWATGCFKLTVNFCMQRIFQMQTERDNFRGVLCVYSKGLTKCFSTAWYEWTEKFHPKPFSYYHQKAAFVSEKLLLSTDTLFFHSLCRWRSKLKYILLCNKDKIKMWSHKRKSYYNDCNRCPVYFADCITSCKA